MTRLAAPPAQTTQLAQGKRPWSATLEPSAKAARLGAGPDAEDTWTCSQCGNFNYGGRLVCNMKRCGAPKPLEAWTCPACGNENHSNRPFCNRRVCGQAMPGLTAQQLTHFAPTAATLAPTPAPRQSLAAQGGGAPPGAWVCSCGNVNFPTRLVCNRKTCSLPRGASAPTAVAAPLGPGNVQRAGPLPVGRASPWAPQRAPVAAAASAAPDGAWVCVGCGNVNWPTRTSCNRGVCGMLRSEADAGPPEAQQSPFECTPITPFGGSAPAATQQGKAEEMPGAWRCTCGNVNWPTRMFCNRRVCGLPRAESDAGPPEPSSGHGYPADVAAREAEDAPEGAWTCQCGNVNWPTRLHCNRRTCTLPRPASL